MRLSKAAHTIRLNTVRQKGMSGTSRHTSAKETPLSIYVAFLLHSQTRRSLLVDKFHGLSLHISYTLRKMCPYSEFFWSLFSRIRTGYGEIRRIQSECGKIRTRITPNMGNIYAVYSISYNQMLILSTQLGNNVCTQFESDGVICPTKLIVQMFSQHLL